MGRRSGRRGLAQDPAPSCGSMAGRADGVRRRRGLRRPRRCRARPPRGRSGGGSSEERSRRADAPERPAGACPARRQADAAAREPEEPDVRHAGPPPARRHGIGEDRFRNAGRRARRSPEADGIASGRRRRRPPRRRADERRETAASGLRRAAPHFGTPRLGSPEPASGGGRIPLAQRRKGPVCGPPRRWGAKKWGRSRKFRRCRRAGDRPG